MSDDLVRCAGQRRGPNRHRRRRSFRKRRCQRRERARREPVEPSGCAYQRPAATIVRTIECPDVVGKKLRERGRCAQLG